MTAALIRGKVRWQCDCALKGIQSHLILPLWKLWCIKLMASQFKLSYELFFKAIHKMHMRVVWDRNSSEIRYFDLNANYLLFNWKKIKAEIGWQMSLFTMYTKNFLFFLPFGNYLCYGLHIILSKWRFSVYISSNLLHLRVEPLHIIHLNFNLPLTSNQKWCWILYCAYCIGDFWHDTDVIYNI